MRLVSPDVLQHQSDLKTALSRIGRARKSGLRLLQQDVLAQRDAVLGDRRNFADAVNAYIEKKLATE